MNKELIVNATEKGVELALVENKKLVELHFEKNDNQFNVGDIYLGKISKIIPGLNAAFVEVGYEKEAFLHFTDLGPNIKSLIKYSQNAINGFNANLLSGFELEPENSKNGKINAVLKPKQSILVQILKEPIGAKGPRLNAEISLPGRYIVLTPFSNHISISKKIDSKEERNRLLKIIESIKPENFGVIIRTAAESKNTSDLHLDMISLTEKWQNMQKSCHGAVAPQLISSELNKTSSILRDLLNDSFNKIIVNDKAIFQEIKNFISKIAPDKEGIVQLYTGGLHIFDSYGVTLQIKASFGKQVPVQGGGYLIIEKTEALHVIDVNSGNSVGSANKALEDHILKINTDAALEIARQLRLRDMGGIVVIDFIDIKNPKYRQELFNTMQEAMKYDRAKHSIIPISKFGVMQLTRQRVRPEIEIATAEVCASCNGTGQVGASILLIDHIENDISQVLIENNHKSIKLVVHPFIEGYLTKGFLSKLRKWMWKYKKIINIKSDNNFGLTTYQIFDQNSEEINLD